MRLAVVANGFGRVNMFVDVLVMSKILKSTATNYIYQYVCIRRSINRNVYDFRVD